MKPELQRLLVQGLNELGCGEGYFGPAGFERLLSSLDRYFAEILKWNEKIGLVRAGEREIIVKHFLDSASTFSWFREECANRGLADGVHVNAPSTRPLQATQASEFFVDVADLGSGVGLPGIMLALLFKDQRQFRMHIIEKQQRRCTFLESTLSLLNLNKTVTLHPQRAETLNLKFDIVTSRAYAKLSPEKCRLQMSLLKVGGIIAAYKGRRETIHEEFRGNFPEEGQIIPLSVPFLEAERNLVVLPNFEEVPE